MEKRIKRIYVDTTVILGLYDYHLPEHQVEQINATPESDNLADCYIAENVVGIGSRNDCRHVAIATIHADGIVSWNMGDMVTRADKYNSVNEAQGYRGIKIVTPNQYKEIYHGK